MRSVQKSTYTVEFVTCHVTSYWWPVDGYLRTHKQVIITSHRLRMRGWLPKCHQKTKQTAPRQSTRPYARAIICRYLASSTLHRGTRGCFPSPQNTVWSWDRVSCLMYAKVDFWPKITCAALNALLWAQAWYTWQKNGEPKLSKTIGYVGIIKLNYHTINQRIYSNYHGQTFWFFFQAHFTLHLGRQKQLSPLVLR